MSCLKIKVQRCNMPHLKAFGMINLQYEIRICQKIYNRVTMTVYVKCVFLFNMHKKLYCQIVYHLVPSNKHVKNLVKFWSSQPGGFKITT